MSGPEWVGDGYCDRWGGYNTQGCGWDGGDCCAENCLPGDFSCAYTMECLEPAVESGMNIVKNTGQNKCLGAFDYVGSPKYRTVAQSDCTDSRTLRWTYDRNTKEIKNLDNNFCLERSTTSVTLTTKPCSRTTVNQEWVEGLDGRIQASGTSDCVCSTGNSGALLCDCGTSANGYKQEWLIPEKFFG